MLSQSLFTLVLLVSTWKLDTASGEVPFPKEFGEVDHSNNRNLILKGEKNTGSITNNENSDLTSTNSQLKLEDNTNLKLHVEEGNLDIKKCSNFNLSGKKNKVVIASTKNFKLEGDGNDLEGTSNENTDLKGSHGVIKLFDNNNVEIEGDNNDVLAKANKNLKVSGNENKITIEKTQNHKLQPTSSTLPKWVPFTSPDTITVFITSANPASKCVQGGDMPADGPNSKFEIDYVDRADIKGGNYKLGIFEFDIKPTAVNSYEVTFKDTNGGTTEVKSTKSDHALLSLTKDSTTQDLKLQGFTVKKKDGDDKTFNLEFAPLC